MELRIAVITKTKLEKMQHGPFDYEDWFGVGNVYVERTSTTRELQYKDGEEWKTVPTVEIKG
jgi:hypothetical protein